MLLKVYEEENRHGSGDIRSRLLAVQARETDEVYYQIGETHSFLLLRSGFI